MSPSDCVGILVADDDDDVRESLVEILNEEGYPAYGARHGREALDKLRSGRPLPCVILLDMRMPVMDGREFRAEQLLDPRLREVPVVVITADAHAVETGAALAATEAMRKPVSLGALLEVAERFCGKAERGNPSP
jgi:CheY-like chemotaxis protein